VLTKISRERDYIPDAKRLLAYNEEVEILQAAQDDAAMQKFEEDQYLENANQENSHDKPYFDVSSTAKAASVPVPVLSPLPSRHPNSGDTEKSIPLSEPKKALSSASAQSIASIQPPVKKIVQKSPVESTSQSFGFTSILDMINNPQIPNKYRIQAKVIDHMPHEITNFAKSVCFDCRRR
jgi:hypothetical protein